MTEGAVEKLISWFLGVSHTGASLAEDAVTPYVYNMEQAAAIFTFPGIDAAFARIRSQLLAQIAALPTSPDPVAAYTAIQREIRALEDMHTFWSKKGSSSQSSSESQGSQSQEPSETNK